MKCWIGIDLGSTTTKAILLDADGRVLGRGITNSRSNYDIACAVAKSEALTDARFTLFGAALAANSSSAGDRTQFLERLRRNFRLEQYLHQLEALEETCYVHAAAHNASQAIEPIFRSMRTEATSLFAQGAKARSDFFRDLAGSRYAAFARFFAHRDGIDFEHAIGLFDKSIISVENGVVATAFQEMLGAAVRRTLHEHRGDQRANELESLLVDAADAHFVEAVVVGTGYGRARLPFPKEQIRSEILCHGLGAHRLFPNTRTVLDIGGQDTKAIQVDAEGIVTSFQMNDRCAAGCGRYLGYIAEEMNLGIHELGPLALQAKKKVRINSTCTVFAGAELRDRLSSGQRREDILDGLHRAIMLRAMSLLARSGGVADEFTFTGGVANNAAAVRALKELVRENWGERTFNISSDSIYTGALGAALYALRMSSPAPEPFVAGGAR